MESEGGGVDWCVIEELEILVKLGPGEVDVDFKMIFVLQVLILCFERF